jgi:hypothetical protein
MNAEITIFDKDGAPFSKNYFIENGELKGNGDFSHMARGVATRAVLSHISELADLIEAKNPRRAFATGVLIPEIGPSTLLASQEKLGDYPGARKRGRENFFYREGEGLLQFDLDDDWGPRELAEVFPALNFSECVKRRSTSHGITIDATGWRKEGGWHLYVHVLDMSVPAFVENLTTICAARGLAKGSLGSVGQFLKRYPFDAGIYQPERINFEGPAVLGPGLSQAERPVEWFDGEPADLRKVIATPEERHRAETFWRSEELRLLPERELKRSKAAAPKIAKLVEKGVSEAEARARVLNDLDFNVLRATDALHFVKFGWATVADVFASPDKFVNERCADPYECLAYQSQNPAILRRREGDGGLWIDSFAHGRTRYELMEDEPSAGDDAAGAIPLFPDPIKPDEYPVDALGPILGPAVQEIARRIQAPTALAAQSVLAVASFAVQAHVDVMLSHGQAAPTSLNLATLADSGERKSASDKEPSAPVNEYAERLQAQYEMDKALTVR